MTTYDLSVTDVQASEEARDLQTLLFMDLHNSLSPEPEDIPEAERLAPEPSLESLQLELPDEDSEPSPFDGIGITLTEPSLVARFCAATWSTLRLCCCLSKTAIYPPVPSRLGASQTDSREVCRSYGAPDQEPSSSITFVTNLALKCTRLAICCRVVSVRVSEQLAPS